MRTLYRSVVLTLVMAVVVGVGYPVAGWALSQWWFHAQANGSLTKDGSSLIGQPWSTTSNGTLVINPMWFQGRPDPDNPLELNGTPGESGSASLGPRSAVLVADTASFLAAWRKVGIEHPTEDLVTTSGSGVDPDITPADALVQLPMLLRARPYLSDAELRSLIARETQGPQGGFLGGSYLDVLQLNMALAKLAAAEGH